MATKIRLKRFGKTRSPHYRIIVIDSRSKRDGQAIEEIGLYHPKNDPSVMKIDSERAQYWLSVGAQPTEAVVAIMKRTGDWQKFSGDTSPPVWTRSLSVATARPSLPRPWPRTAAPLRPPSPRHRRRSPTTMPRPQRRRSPRTSPPTRPSLLKRPDHAGRCARTPRGRNCLQPR